MKFMLLLLLVLLGLPAEAKVPVRSESSLEFYTTLASRSQLESRETYLRCAQRAKAVFLKQGGLVDLDPSVPTLVLPDLHAQRDYLLAALELRLASGRVFELMASNKLQVLCLGDGMHSENRAVSRWLKAEEEMLMGQKSEAMRAEMVESLGLLRMVMELKCRFPRRFYFVRGNHEDMDPKVPYRKFTRSGESNLVRVGLLGNLGPIFSSSGTVVNSRCP